MQVSTKLLSNFCKNQSPNLTNPVFQKQAPKITKLDSDVKLFMLFAMLYFF
jgi:hypothetical protein